MFEQYHAQIKREAIASYPHEGVWLITTEGCRQVPNVAEDPENFFRVAKHDMAAATVAGLLAVVHSHPNWHPCPSASDMRCQDASGVPWGILATDGKRTTDIVWFGDQADKLPLIGRPFQHGVTDCYAIIRDYYSIELGISIPEFPRDWEWWLKGDDLYRDGFGKAGFHRIEQSEAKPGDVWIAQLRSPVPNHGGILLEGGLGLHHPSSRNPIDPSHLSRREPISRWAQHIVLWLRHESR